MKGLDPGGVHQQTGSRLIEAGTEFLEESIPWVGLNRFAVVFESGRAVSDG